ncbi:MAG: hypothetical protein QNJ17_02845 [Desulfocapsaceae bacterium]|nr:hypothetical protein [Desulfocapsaceae bacterium]
METFIQPKELVPNSGYQSQRKRVLAKLSPAMIEKPLADIVNGFNSLPQCFTLQCCYGHFTYEGQEDPINVQPLPVRSTLTDVEYRIAYLALCVENSTSGKSLLGMLKEIPTVSPDNIQFGSAEWFWQQQINSYVLQVEPHRFRDEDKVTVEYSEAIFIEKTRNNFFRRLALLLAELM